ncbi:uncharacterized protein EV422DRAFT_180647 [Fimicolochytrium jonesii]|uniref:uncharacterized protein n=1 Tax=Fimicolochytrium jonesii TaxID=1396493 RepID=UPI0022FE23F5|nr:uncharacterized protein EV422DRAFT_180647 [Fimicolochytrium jonesii]KAI8818336.1 hypothetical protein EV422DRAFT_180647 [Fimicolochytrium jonesii]
MSTTASSRPVDMLILGMGWSGTYVATLLTSLDISFEATTTTGRDGTLKFEYDPDSTDPTPFEQLPDAKTVLVTFPLRGKQSALNLADLYEQTHASTAVTQQYILLGSTRPYSTTAGDAGDVWVDRNSNPDLTIDAPRQEAEAALLARGGRGGRGSGCVLNLAGLYGGTRDPRNWVPRVAPDLPALRGKGSLHVIHGEDVAQAVLAVSRDFTPGERWLVTDTRVYCWWDLAAAWGDRDEARWVLRLMEEAGVRGLPRPVEMLGRAVDSTAFWRRFGVVPLRPSLKP